MSVYERGLAALTGLCELELGASRRLLLFVNVKYTSPVLGWVPHHSGRSILVAPTASAARREFTLTSASLANA